MEKFGEYCREWHGNGCFGGGSGQENGQGDGQGSGRSNIGMFRFTDLYDGKGYDDCYR